MYPSMSDRVTCLVASPSLCPSCTDKKIHAGSISYHTQKHARMKVRQDMDERWKVSARKWIDLRDLRGNVDGHLADAGEGRVEAAACQIFL